jgi:peptidoglycan/LPS O-acetylase OafA/YrhL
MVRAVEPIDAAGAAHPAPGADDAMYRGSRLAASFLLFLTGLAVGAIALFVVPQAVGGAGGRWLTPLAILFAIGHLGALIGVARNRDWGRNLAVFIAELGGGLAILGGIALLTGAHPFGAGSTAGPGIVAWGAAVYALLGIAAGRVPVLDRLTPLERRRVAFGPSFAGMAR